MNTIRTFICVLLGMGAASTMAQNVVDDPREGFRFTILDTWMQVAPEEVDTLNAIAETGSPTSEFVYLDAYSPSGSMLEMPYMLVQRNKSGYRGASAEEIASAFGAEVLNETDLQFSDEIENVIGAVSVGDSILDLVNNRVLVRASAAYGGTPIDIFMVVFLGMDSAMQFNFYTPAGEMENHIGTFEEIAQSFAYTGNEGWSAAKPARPLRRVLIYAIIGGILGLVITLVISIIPKKA